jgi:hypothetical protein
MKSMIAIIACALATSSAYAADGKSKVIVAKLEGKAQTAATMSKTSSKPARSTPAVATESQVCDYSVETDCR